VVISKAKKLTQKLPLLTKHHYYDLTPKDVAPARAYIKNYWPKLERFHPKDADTLIGLPKPYLVPAHEEGREFDFNELYYWDSYFMAQGLLNNDHKELVLGILDDLLYLFERCRIIPNASRTYLMGRSQPPLLTSYIMDAYKTYGLGEKWLAKAMRIAEEEYHTVWLGEQKPNARLVYRGLSRYYDVNYLNDLAEAESGWDMTPRFNRRALNYLPVDLNALLYKYESDFAEAAEILGNKNDVIKWRRAAHSRMNTMNTLMWSELRGLYYDYNYVKEKRGSVSSLAAYFPMWAGMVTERQAKRLVENLKKFEEKGGLATTDPAPLGQLVPGSLPMQWAYPNGWAPLQLMVIKGLERYGYHADARRIALKWLKNNNDWFIRHGHFLEKYNVAQPSKPPMKGLYPSQTGFGWTNAVFEKLCRDYIDEKA
jgi:alpha,alpha-trehalase